MDDIEIDSDAVMAMNKTRITVERTLCVCLCVIHDGGGARSAQRITCNFFLQNSSPLRRSNQLFTQK